MKFGKRLKEAKQESLPEWRDQFLSYKELKGLVRLISSSPPQLVMRGSVEFVELLNDEIEKFNAFFVEQEEDLIIGHKELQQRIQRVMETWGPNGKHPSEEIYREEMARIKKDIVNFHGEMVLLENYSAINYTGLDKILKKYDKRTGAMLRSPFIQKIQRQPFFKTDLISKLVKVWEATLEAVFPAEEGEERPAKKGGESVAVAVAVAVAGEGVFRKTVAALLTMREIRRGSSTYGPLSLPPLDFPDSDLFRSISVLFSDTDAMIKD